MPDRPSLRPTPFSLRLSSDERARLEREAGDLALGAYIRSRLLDQAGNLPVVKPSRRRGRMPVKDHAALAQVLALLGQSRIASNLNQLAKAVHCGSLPLDDDLARDLRDAVEHVVAIRRLLVGALGLDVASTPGAPAGGAP